MLCLERVVVSNDAAGLRPVLVCGSCAVCQVTQRWEVLLHIQDVGMGVHTLHTRSYLHLSSLMLW